MSIFAFIGSYAEPDGPGVYACAYDADSGRLTLLDQTDGLVNPTFVDIETDSRIIYALTERKSDDGARLGAAAALRFDPASGRLERLGEPAVTLPATACHISLDRMGKIAMTCSYHGGMLSVSPIEADGNVGTASEVVRHAGRSLRPVQSQARVHSAVVSPDGRLVAVSDLGLDKVFIYALDPDAGRLTLRSETDIEPGSGPRHFVFHPSLPYGYGINELSSTITVYAFDAEAGRLSVVQTISTLPDGYEGDNACADIHLSPDGRFLYGSNRGHDSLAVCRVSSGDGRLTPVQYAPTLGGHPRNFAIAPDGRFALVANRDGGNVVTFARDADAGTLTPTGSELQVSKPVCVRFAELGS